MPTMCCLSKGETACIWKQETAEEERRGGGENREVIVYVRVRQPCKRGLKQKEREKEGRERRVAGMVGLGKDKKRNTRREKGADRRKKLRTASQNEKVNR